MNIQPLTILPVLNRALVDPDKSHYYHLRQTDTTTKDPELSTHKLTLEAAKRIWTTYSSEDHSRKTVETESAQSTNALGLNLGVESIEVHNASSSSGVRLPSHLSS